MNFRVICTCGLLHLLHMEANEWREAEAVKPFAILPPTERRDLLLTLAEQSYLPAVILEKDFWVC